MKKEDFGWSLNPLTTFLQLFLGIPLSCSTIKKKKSKIKILALFAAIVVTNLFINGPRGIEISRFQFMSKIYSNDKYESSYRYLKENPFGIVKLVKIIADMAFFCYVPFIHITFVATILFDPNWKKLIEILDKIQRKMKLDKEFHRKCRRMCFMALVQLSIVNINSKILSIKNK